MITESVKREYGTTWRGVVHMPINVCAHCGESDDPESTKHWPRDADDDLVCPRCAEREGLEAE